MSETLEVNFKAFFGIVQQDINLVAHDHGWWEGYQNDSDKLMLMVTEIAEACEALRSPEPKIDEHCPEFLNIEVELADTIIRIMDFAQERKLRVAEALLAKHNYNKTRPFKHGGKLF